MACPKTIHITVLLDKRMHQYRTPKLIIGSQVISIVFYRLHTCLLGMYVLPNTMQWSQSLFENTSVTLAISRDFMLTFKKFLPPLPVNYKGKSKNRIRLHNEFNFIKV